MHYLTAPQDSNMEHFFQLEEYPEASMDEYLTRRDLVLHIQYESRLEDGVVDIAGTELTFAKRSESAVFGTSCPANPYDAGYRGECDGTIGDEEASELAWNVMARTSSQACRELIAETFCAYKVTWQESVSLDFPISEKESGFLSKTEPTLNLIPKEIKSHLIAFSLANLWGFQCEKEPNWVASF